MEPILYGVRARRRLNEIARDCITCASKPLLLWMDKTTHYAQKNSNFLARTGEYEWKGALRSIHLPDDHRCIIIANGDVAPVRRLGKIDGGTVADVVLWE